MTPACGFSPAVRRGVLNVKVDVMRITKCMCVHLLKMCTPVSQPASVTPDPHQPERTG